MLKALLGCACIFSFGIFDDNEVGISAGGNNGISGGNHTGNRRVAGH